MTRIAELDFSHSVVTFDDPEHPSGLGIPTTQPLQGDPFEAFARLGPDRYAWLTATAVWGENEHPWALVRRYDVDGDSDAHVPSRLPDPRLRLSGEIVVTDDLEAGRAARSPGSAPRRPRRVQTRAWTEDDARPFDVVVTDGIADADPATLVVLAGGGIPSGAAFLTEAGLAGRLAQSEENLTVDITPRGEVVPPPASWWQRRALARLPRRIVVAGTARPDTSGSAHV
ncbi:hypothetical protein ABZ477_06105 [Microbacterium sp. NPDC019599]|uniref:hypothetical protein n=1 Tax=Microbacterium sp. NPDC019599 TaxID=3154690 RepID=UPI0034018436